MSNACPAWVRPSSWLVGSLLLLLVCVGQHASAVEVREEIVTRKLSLDPDGTLSVHNKDGAIQIYGSDGTEVSIRAVKRAYSDDRLKEISVVVRGTSKNMVIETVSPKEQGWRFGDRSGTVDYVITVPQTIVIKEMKMANGEVTLYGLQGGKATLSLVNGFVTAHNCFSDLDLAIDHGRLNVTYDWWDDRKFTVKLSSRQGNIRANIPTEASVGIIARTEQGHVVNRLKRGDVAETQNATFETTPAPPATFEINSIEGNIDILKAY